MWEGRRIALVVCRNFSTSPSRLIIQHVVLYCLAVGRVVEVAAESRQILPYIFVGDALKFHLIDGYHYASSGNALGTMD